MLYTDNGLTLNIKKKDGPVFVADLAQLQSQLEKASRRKLVLGGQLMMVSLEPLKAHPDFVAQPARKITGSVVPPSKSTRKLNIMLDKAGLELLVKSRQKPVFAIDALLRYGLKQKGNTEQYVLGAMSASGGTQVLILVFKKQELIGYSEYQLAAANSNTYEADLQLLLERLRREAPLAAFHWCGPLAQPRLQQFKVPDDTFWATANTQSLSITGKPGFLRKHGIAMALVALSAVGYVSAIYLPFREYQYAQKDLVQESQSLKGETTFSAERLTVLRSRQAVFQKHLATERRFNQFMDVLAAFAQEPGIYVKSAQLLSNTPDAATQKVGKPADFEISIETSKVSGGVSVLDQGKPILISLSARTGGNLRLALGSEGFKESTGENGGNVRVYKIQGEFKNDN